MAGTVYKSITLLFKSKGLMARDAIDRMPEHTYLNMNGCLEREENAISSRFGSIVINRDPTGTGTTNYLFSSPPVTLSRLKSLNGSTFRYAALADGSLWRRATDIQGAYTQILAAATLSGQPFTTLVVTMYQSAQPWLLLCDGKQMVKDNGLLTAPQQLGIFGPWMPAICQAYAPGVEILNSFLSTTGFTAGGGVTITGVSGFETADALYYGPQLDGDHWEYQWSITPGTPCAIPDGAYIAISANLVPLPPITIYGIKFGSDSYNSTYNFATVPSTASNLAYGIATMAGMSVSVPASSTGTLTYLFPLSLDLSNYEAADLVVIVMRVTSPGNVSNVSVSFDVNSSGYTSSYYTKTITPVSYQGFISDPLSTDAVTALTDAVLLESITGQATQEDVTSLSNQISQLTSSNLGSNDAWSVIYLQKGDFLPIGNAGDPGLTWANITGFQIQIVTNTNGSTDVDFNSLYMQGSPTATGVGTNAGPSSYAGVGYDFRYIYFNINTGTPSNPSDQQLYASTPDNPGSVSTLTVLRQAIGVIGQYSIDPQVTHIQIFVRGGLYGDNWRYVDQIPNKLPVSSSIPIEFIAYISVVGTTVTITTTFLNAFGTGSQVVLLGLFAYPALNSQTVTITANPSPSQFQFTFPGLTPTNPVVEVGQINPASNASFPGGGLFNYVYNSPDTVLQQGKILGLANDVPVSSSLQTPISTTLNTAIVSIPSPNINYPLLLTVTVAQSSATFVPHQIVNVGTPSNFEQVIVTNGGTGQFQAWFELSHAVGDPVQVFSIPAQPVTLCAQAYNLTWYAGDPNNPHYLYYCNASYPENVSPANYIPCGIPSDPITLVINKRGTLFVRTYSTWYQIFPGSPPYSQTTGSKHGSTASYDWGDAEGEVYYAAQDGIRTFQGSDGSYRSLPIEWLWRDNPQTPVPLIDTTQLSKFLGAYVNNTATFVYTGQDGNRHQIIWDSQYKRWRNNDIAATALYLEADTNTLVYAKPITIPGTGSGWVIVYDSYSQDYDDGGWVSGTLAEVAVAMTLQTPYLDLGTPNNQKQWNVLTIDANPNGQVITPLLLFDDNNGTVVPVAPSPATFTGTVRDKFSFQINAGLGTPGYRISLQLSAAVTSAPVIYQADLYAAELADQRTSYDTYWIKLGTDETKLIKQAFIDYTTASTNTITLQIYADGNVNPYLTFILPANPNRSDVPMRVRFPAQITRLFRMVMISNDQFQIWSPVQLDWKALSGNGKGYQRSDLGSTTP